VQCVEAAERLLAEELGSDPELEQHMATCSRCTHTAQGIGRVDYVLRRSLVVPPPLELQARLAQLVMVAPVQPRVSPWWARIPELVGQFNLTEWLSQRPQMIAAQGLAALMLGLASWTVFGWVSAYQPMVGDVAYAMELVAASPAVIYLGGIQIDFQSLALWSGIGVAGWLVSENGLIGRRIGSSRLQLP
jgi:hypothetical protein